MSGNASTVDYSPVSIFMHADPVVQGIMVMLVLASAFSWSIMIDRFWKIRAERSANKAIDRHIKDVGDADALRDLCLGSPSAACRVLASVQQEWLWSLGKAREGYDQVRARILSTADLAISYEASKLAGHTSYLATIGSISPFVGLFGTVWGIMRSFISIGQSQDTSLAVVAPGIAEALMATAVGLFCAIPAVIGYNRLLHSLASIDGDWRALTGQIEIIISRQFGGKS